MSLSGSLTINEDETTAKPIGRRGKPLTADPSTAGSVARQIKKGSLAVEMFDRQKKELVWAAQAKGTIKESRKERLDQLDRALTRMIDQYPPKAK